MQPRPIFVDVANQSVEYGSRRSSAATAFNEDSEQIELYFVERDEEEGTVNFFNYSGKTVKLAVGVTAPAAIVTAWSAITTSVTTTITAVTTGGGGNNAKQKISFSALPDSGTFAISFPQRSISVSAISGRTVNAISHGLLNGQRVVLTGFSSPTGFSNGSTFYVQSRTDETFAVALTPSASPAAITANAGSAVLGAIVTPPIAAPLSVAAIQNGIAAAGLAFAGQSILSVVQPAVTAFDLEFGGTFANLPFSNVSVVNNSLARSPGLIGTLNLNTTNVRDLIASGQGENCRLEVEVADGSLRQTYQGDIVLNEDIIQSDSPAPVAANTSFALKSPDGTVFTITVDNDGVLTTTEN